MQIEENLYEQIIISMPIVCIDVVIIYKNKFLLVRRNQKPAKGQWFLPGGRLFKGEALEDCALRKAKEECGLDCILGPMIHYASTMFEDVHSVSFCFVLFAFDDEVEVDETSSEAQWFDYNEYSYKFDDYVEKCLKEAILSR